MNLEFPTPPSPQGRLEAFSNYLNKDVVNSEAAQFNLLAPQFSHLENGLKSSPSDRVLGEDSDEMVCAQCLSSKALAIIPK